jgi:glycosyltransferase involved in cell wall biosynthesis
MTQEISLLCEYATLNGAERSMLATLDGVRAAGFTPVVMAPPKGPLADALAALGVELLPFECSTADGTRVPQSRLREELSTTLRRRRPALLHANSLAMGRLSGPVAVQLGLASVGHLRDIVRLSAQAVADVNCHARLLAVSHATCEFHIGGGLRAENIHVVYNGVDLDEFRPRSPTGCLHRELALPPEAQLISVIGQIGLRKGQDVLLRAAASIADQLPNVHYLVVGRRHSNKEESRRFERGLHDGLREALSGRVHFLGVRNDVARLLGELTLLVHPARQEPLGRVLLEAAAAGLPIVATDVGGTPEIFPPEQNAARLVSPDDDAALAEAILTLLRDPALRLRLGAAARRRAEQRFDIRSSVDDLLTHYRALT